MKIIIGLGNPGKKYENTRHNIGFVFVDKLKELWNFSEFEFNKKFNSEISKGKWGGKEILLVKPQTFMNLSGEAAQSILDFYKLAPDDIIVLHDDLDIIAGEFRLAEDSRSAGHNGVQNIIEKLGTQKFKRIRIGIGKRTADEPQCRLGAHDFVLKDFSEEETKQIENISENIIKKIAELV